MSSSSSRLVNLNIPRLVLWLVSIVVVAGGYFLLTTSNAKQAALYTAGKADYPKLFAAESGTTVGGLLIAVGVLGLLLALTTLVLARRGSTGTEEAISDPAAFDPATLDQRDEDLDDERDDDLAQNQSVPTASEAGAPIVR